MLIRMYHLQHILRQKWPHTLRAQLRLFIAASPKTGNVWLEQLLAHIYDLSIVDLSGVDQVEHLNISQRRFVTHQHLLPTAELLAWGEREEVQFLTVVRHPGDLLISLYYYVNKFAPLWQERGWIGTSPAHVMIGKEMDSPEVLEFVRTKFRSAILGKSLAWLQSDQAVVVRYEALHTDPVATLKAITDQIEPVELERIQQAVEACHVDKMRQQGDMLSMHIRKGKVGNWRQELSETHLAILRDYCLPEITRLGYDLE